MSGQLFNIHQRLISAGYYYSRTSITPTYIIKPLQTVNQLPSRALCFFFFTGVLTTLFFHWKRWWRVGQARQMKGNGVYQYTKIQWKITGAKQAWEENLYTRYRQYVNSAAWVTWLNQQRLLFSLGCGHRLLKRSLCDTISLKHTHTIQTDKLGETQKRLEARCGKEDELSHPSNHAKNKKQRSQLLKCGKIVTNSRFHVFTLKNSALARSWCVKAFFSI